MFKEMEKEWILEAINHLKHRKARPDLTRISLRMKRKHQLSFTETKKLLESLIESGIVVKAVYKNNTSYRDVSQWKKGRLGGQILNSSKMLKRFIHAIEATEKTKDAGVSLKEIEDFLAGQDEEKCFLSGDALKDALENEISNGFLEQFPVGTEMHYAVNANANADKNVFYDTEEGSLGLKFSGEHSAASASLSCSDNENSSHTDARPLVCDDEEADSHSSRQLLRDVIKAIHETEKQEGGGASFEEIKEHLLVERLDLHRVDNLFLLDFLETNCNRGVLLTILRDSITFYTVPGKNLILDLLENNSSTSTPTPSFNEATVDPSTFEAVKNRNFPAHHSTFSSSARSKPAQGKETQTSSSSVQLRPPSKRKRIIKDHGPDFETEIPTKMKHKYSETKHLSCLEIKDSVYPTPTASPASERSDTTMEQSFQNDIKKKRGRPKKEEPMSPGEQEAGDSSRLASQPPELNYPVQEDGAATDTEDVPSASDVNILHWSSRQVATYFKRKGYVEESQSMLHNDLDGAALGMLRRSDVVGPPLGGLLKVKKLGVALKLFRDIRDLLFQGNADNYVDPYEEKAFLRS